MRRRPCCITLAGILAVMPLRADGIVVAIGGAGPAIEQHCPVNQHATMQQPAAEQAFEGGLDFVTCVAEALLHEPPCNAVERVAGIGMARAIATDFGCDA